MIKVKPDGSLEIGEEWKLTEDDLEEIACIIANNSMTPMVKKSAGRWMQGLCHDAIDVGYRVYTPGEGD